MGSLAQKRGSEYCGIHPTVARNSVVMKGKAIPKVSGMKPSWLLERFGAWIYDLFMWPIEVTVARRWRRKLWAGVRGKVLEIGVGTGAGLYAHPPEAEVVAVDGAAGMLARAERRAARLGAKVEFVCADLHALPFPDASFEYVMGSFVLCTVRKPLGVLRELARVLRPGGELRLLEHVRPRSKWLARMLGLLAPHFAKRTWELLPKGGWEIVREENLDRWGLARLYIARLRDAD